MPSELLSSPLKWAEAHETLLWWLAAASVLVLVVTVISMVWLLVHLPRDYFLYPDRYQSGWARQRPVLRVLLRVFSNALGAVFLSAGLLMLFLPGQGILTIVVGLMMIDFPAKNRLVRHVVRRPKLRSSIDAIRKRAGRQPLLLDDANR